MVTRCARVLHHANDSARGSLRRHWSSRRSSGLPVRRIAAAHGGDARRAARQRAAVAGSAAAAHRRTAGSPTAGSTSSHHRVACRCASSRSRRPHPTRARTNVGSASPARIPSGRACTPPTRSTSWPCSTGRSSSVSTTASTISARAIASSSAATPTGGVSSATGRARTPWPWCVRSGPGPSRSRSLRPRPGRRARGGAWWPGPTPTAGRTRSSTAPLSSVYEPADRAACHSSSCGRPADRWRSRVRAAIRRARGSSSRANGASCSVRIETPAGLDSGEAGWHTTDTIDVDIMISGRLQMELPDLDPIVLVPGDSVVQRGTAPQVDAGGRRARPLRGADGRRPAGVERPLNRRQQAAYNPRS